VNFTWQTRDEPLKPVAVAAFGPAARALIASVDKRTELHALRGLAGDDLVLLLGEEEQLPWADGAIYLGRDPEAPSLLLPTLLRPSLPLSLVERAMLRRGSGPFAVIPTRKELIPIDGARPVTHEHLARWTAR